MDHAEQAVRALPPFLQRRMANLVLRGWKIECTPLNAQGANVLRLSWTARCNGVLNGASQSYARKIYIASTLLTLLDQMVGVVEVMSGDDAAADRRGRELGI